MKDNTSRTILQFRKETNLIVLKLAKNTNIFSRNEHFAIKFMYEQVSLQIPGRIFPSSPYPLNAKSSTIVKKKITDSRVTLSQPTLQRSTLGIEAYSV